VCVLRLRSFGTDGVDGDIGLADGGDGIRQQLLHRHCGGQIDMEGNRFGAGRP
jgi:hypothetical protein